MKKYTGFQKLFRAALATTVAMGALVAAAPVYTKAEETKIPTYSDVNVGDHFYEGVLSLTERGFVQGFGDGTYKPYNSVTRGQAAKILALTLGLDTENVKDPGFTDVDKKNEYYGPIAALAEANIISGYSADNTFKPGNKLTRAQMAKIINIGFELEEVELTDTRFTDVKKDDEFAGYVQALLTNKITTGTTPTTFEPYSFVTRGQMASFVVRSEAAVLPGSLIAEDFGAVGETGYSAGVGLADEQTLSDVEELTVEWFDQAGTLLGKGTLTEKLFEELPEATQVSMPFDPEFDYEEDGYWAVEGDFAGEPTKVKFTATFTNGKKASVENTRIASGDIVAQDFGFVSGTLYSAFFCLFEKNRNSTTSTPKLSNKPR